ncbi:hypothetical protein GCM10010123_27480 [Pilimelia anulata]|uniref:GmrSD restriction endonucleases C-terminal domain-containing protein n=1 Tax=Pilimelia anulata TaxID=53371 RepID=A0A8J3B9Y9_9ACTN|nr:HNH endonuclease family protein [Pilimelia anulata]GGJ96044.1 hypothetical protein GCM10010123_27480 [Pilimelia anulata]
MNRARTLATITALLTAAATATVATPAAAATHSAPLHTSIAGLPVAAEVRTGYSRSLFPHWTDADADGCNTRYEVLIAEATTAPGVGAGCALTGGRWYSYYDNALWNQPADLDIDHMVALAEAWDSGARTWTTARRQSFANDLGDNRSLAAVTDSVNQAKGDRDPTTWVPPYAPARCRYIGEFVAVKIRWGLTVDSAEKSALTAYGDACPNITLTVTTV